MLTGSREGVSACLSACMPVYLPFCLSSHLTVYLSVCLLLRWVSAEMLCFISQYWTGYVLQQHVCLCCVWHYSIFNWISQMFSYWNVHRWM